MIRITLEPTTPLSSFAENHLDKLRFDSPAPYVKPSSIFDGLHLNCIRKGIKKLGEESTASRVMRIALLAFLAITIIGIPFIFLWLKESRKFFNNEYLKERAIQKINDEVNKINNQAQMIEQLGLHLFDKIPIASEEQLTVDKIPASLM